MIKNNFEEGKDTLDVSVLCGCVCDSMSVYTALLFRGAGGGWGVLAKKNRETPTLLLVNDGWHVFKKWVLR